MDNGKEAAQAETPEASRDTIKGPKFQEDFKAALEKWRTEGCQRAPEGQAEGVCGAAPHRTKMLPAKDGVVVILTDCAAGHEAVWTFEVAENAMRDELKAQQAAAAKAGEGKDPGKASVKITMDLRTNEVTIDPWVPTPGMGLQLAAMLTAHFTAQFNAGTKTPKLYAPKRDLVHPTNGKKLLDA